MPTTMSDIRRALAARNLPLRSCGLNADWSVMAWHLGPSAIPNRTSGDLYLLEDEEDESSFTLVRRHIVGEDSLDGNDEIVEIAWGSLEVVLDVARPVVERRTADRALAEWEASG